MKFLTRYECDELYEITGDLYKIIEAVGNKCPVFCNCIRIMRNNLKLCIDTDYVKIVELTGYLIEDWKMIFGREKNIEAFHISSENIDKQAEINYYIQKKLMRIDVILGTAIPSVNILNLRKWYSIWELNNIGDKFFANKSTWESNIQYFKKYAKEEPSKIEGVDNDVWFYTKCLGITNDEEKLIMWYNTEIPGYGYLKPIDIIKLQNGNNILKGFLLNTHI